MPRYEGPKQSRCERRVPYDDERAQAFQRTSAYCGRYRVGGGGTIATKVGVAWNKAWAGGEPVWHGRFEGDRLFIESPPMAHSSVNNRVVRVIVT